jgi:hypothetical protein
LLLSLNIDIGFEHGNPSIIFKGYYTNTIDKYHVKVGPLLVSILFQKKGTCTILNRKVAGAFKYIGYGRNFGYCLVKSENYIIFFSNDVPRLNVYIITSKKRSVFYLLNRLVLCWYYDFPIPSNYTVLFYFFPAIILNSGGYKYLIASSPVLNIFHFFDCFVIYTILGGLCPFLKPVIFRFRPSMGES